MPTTVPALPRGASPAQQERIPPALRQRVALLPRRTSPCPCFQERRSTLLHNRGTWWCCTLWPPVALAVSLGATISRRPCNPQRYAEPRRWRPVHAQPLRLRLAARLRLLRGRAAGVRRLQPEARELALPSAWRTAGAPACGGLPA